MSTKGILILGALLLLIIGGLYYFFTIRETEQSGGAENNGGSLPSGGATPPPPPPSLEDTINTRTRGGGTMPVKNFYKNAKEITTEGDVVVTDISDFILMYFPQDQSFIIRLNNSDVQRARTTAESAFLAFLGITKEQACNLRVSLTIPLAINSTYGGKDYGLSFCSWGIPF